MNSPLYEALQATAIQESRYNAAWLDAHATAYRREFQGIMQRKPGPDDILLLFWLMYWKSEPFLFENDQKQLAFSNIMSTAIQRLHSKLTPPRDPVHETIRANVKIWV